MYSWRVCHQLSKCEEFSLAAAGEAAYSCGFPLNIYDDTFFLYIELYVEHDHEDSEEVVEVVILQLVIIVLYSIYSIQ